MLKRAAILRSKPIHFEYDYDFFNMNFHEKIFFLASLLWNKQFFYYIIIGILLMLKKVMHNLYGNNGNYEV